MLLSLKKFWSGPTVIFALALALRLFSLWQNPSALDLPLNHDALRYNMLAESVLAGDGLVFMGHYAQVSPGYPLFLAGIYKISGSIRLAVLVVQCALGALLALLIYLIALSVFSQRAALAAGIFSALYWPLIKIGEKLLSEALFIPLLAAALYLFIRARDRENTAALTGSAVLFALAVLTRPVVLYFSAALAALLAWDCYKSGNKAALARLVLFPAVFFLILSPWAVRNRIRLGEFIFTNSNSGMVVAAGNRPSEGKIFGFDLTASQLRPEDRYILSLPEVQRDRALKALAWKEISNAPGKIPGLLLYKTLYFISPFDWEVLGHLNGVFNPWFLWALLFAPLGLAAGQADRNRWLLLWLLLYFYLISMATYASSRLRLPVEPVFIVYAAAGWSVVERKISGFRWWLALIFLALSTAAGYFYSVELKTAARTFLEAAGIW